MRLASMATQKQSAGVEAQETGIGLRVTAEESLEQVGLLGFGRQSGGWATALECRR